MANYEEEFEQAESGLQKFAFLSILRTIWKRRIRIASAWLLLAAGAAVVVHTLPSVYQAEALVLIDSQKIPEKFVSATVASDLEERITTIRQLLLSGGELKKIIENFGLYKEERKTQFEEDILDMMRADISITLDLGGPTGTNQKKAQRPGAFRIAYQGPDPAVVTRVTNRLADLYVEQNLKTREGQAAGTSEFLDTQLREAKKHLDEVEAQVSAYKVQHNGELPEQERVLAATLARLQTELEANRDATNRAQQTKVTLESSITALESNLSTQMRAWEQALRPENTAATVSLPGKPAEAPEVKASGPLEAQLAQLRVRFTENHPDIIKLRTELENVKRMESERQPGAAAASDPAPANGAAPIRKPATVEPPEIVHTRNQLVTLKAQLKGSETELANREAEQQRILRDLGGYQSRIERLPLREQELAQITRDYEVSKENYKSLVDKQMAAGMSLDMERRQQSERFVVLDRAQVPEKPIKPQRPKLYAAGVVASLAIALLLGFAVELRRNHLLGEWELPAGTPVLARLPYIEVPLERHLTKSTSRGWFRPKKAPAGGALALHPDLDRL
jgi:polysaccharide chain length determinant protein (PEP-CTERM system associated)